MEDLVIAVADLNAVDIQEILAAHLAFTQTHCERADLPVLDISGLAAGEVIVVEARRAGELLAIGALRRLDASHAELKSMHTSETARNHGVGRAVLTHLLELAQAHGYHRISLETGAMAVFAPARALYASVGFRPCAPFGDYPDTPHSRCLTLELTADSTAVSQDLFESMLTGGHPNSLGRTIEVVEAVIDNKEKLAELYTCYFSRDEVVRLRTSNAMKRVCAQHPEWFEPYLDKLISEIADIDQASAQWTLAQLFASLEPRMSKAQKQAAITVMQRNLENNHDWIVQTQTMQTLTDWATTDARLRMWLVPQLIKASADHRKSVAGRAKKLRQVLL
ncbi:MAG: GNAT family N-acetyltransferase [Actinomycetota bacterium]